MFLNLIAKSISDVIFQTGTDLEVYGKHSIKQLHNTFNREFKRMRQKFHKRISHFNVPQTTNLQPSQPCSHPHDSHQDKIKPAIGQ